jgi:hypothetical protein
MDRAMALAAYRLSQKGLTHRQIAEQIGCDVKAVKGKILAGSRRAEPESTAESRNDD